MRGEKRRPAELYAMAKRRTRENGGEKSSGAKV